jgi:hypothetical protein
MIERCIMTITGFLLLVVMAAFLMVVPAMVAIGIVVVTIGTVLIFVLGVQVGARVVRGRDVAQDF